MIYTLKVIFKTVSWALRLVWAGWIVYSITRLTIATDLPDFTKSGAIMLGVLWLVTIVAGLALIKSVSNDKPISFEPPHPLQPIVDKLCANKMLSDNDLQAIHTYYVEHDLIDSTLDHYLQRQTEQFAQDLG